MVAEPVPINTYFNGETMPMGAAQRGRYVDGEKTEQHIEIREDGKSNCLTTVQKDSLVCSPVRIGQYGKGGQGQRIYSVVGKSVTLSANGGGQGAKTGLYKIDLPDGDYIIRKLTPIEAERLQTRQLHGRHFQYPAIQVYRQWVDGRCDRTHLGRDSRCLIKS